MKKICFLVLLSSIINLRAQTPDGVSCLPNTFWGIGQYGPIYQFTLDGDSVYSSAPTGDSLAIPNNHLLSSLAYCNNLNGGALSPTFYASNNSYNLFYLDTGNIWVQCPQASDWNIFNCGGNGNYFYSLYNSDPKGVISRYDGHSFTDIFYDSTDFFNVADLAVDDSGNVYAFRGSTQQNLQWLDVISPEGKILKQYNFIIANSQGADGTFLMNGILYIDFDISGVEYIDELLPIFLGADSAIMQPPIKMPSTYSLLADFAGCDAGIPTAVANILQAQRPTINLFPNPAATNIHISSEQPFTYTVYNLYGQLVYNKNSNVMVTDLDISAYPAGLYLLVAQQGENKEIVEKFIILH